MKLTNTKMNVANKWAVMLEEIDNEGRDSGIWAYSKKGYYFESMGCHTAHEYSQKELMKVIRTLKPCNCEQCQQASENPNLESVQSEQEPEQLNTKISVAKETINESDKKFEGKKLSLTWEQLQKLPNNMGEEILEDFISNYNWIKGFEMTKSEAIAYLEENPLEAEVVVYGIHGLMVSVEGMQGISRVHWNIHKLEPFKALFEEEEKNKCTFCGREDTCGTKSVGGYTILEVCTDCESEIESENEIPEELHLCNGCDSMYHDEMSKGECCEGHDFRVVDKGDMGY